MTKTIGTKAQIKNSILRHSAPLRPWALVPCIIILGLCGCGGKETKKTANESIPVRCRRVEIRNVKRTLDYAASLKAEDQASVYSKVTGKIIEKLKDDGSTVKKGETIAYIDRDEIGFKFEKAPLDSPLTGILGMVTIDRGDSVSPQSPVAEVVSIDNMRVSLDIPEKHLTDVALNQLAEISVDAFPDTFFSGKVTKISPIVDLETRAAPIELFIANPEHKLKPGMFARVKLILENKPNALLIPKEAVLGKGNELSVYAINGKTAHQRKVKVGVKEGGQIEIVEGLQAGETVVIMGQQRLRDGAEVIVEEDNPAK